MACEYGIIKNPLLEFSCCALIAIAFVAGMTMLLLSDWFDNDRVENAINYRSEQIYIEQEAQRRANES